MIPTVEVGVIEPPVAVNCQFETPETSAPHKNLPDVELYKTVCDSAEQSPKSDWKKPFETDRRDVLAFTRTAKYDVVACVEVERREVR